MKVKIVLPREFMLLTIELCVKKVAIQLNVFVKLTVNIIMILGY